MNHMGLLLGSPDEITSFKNAPKDVAVRKDYKSSSMLMTDGLNHIYSRIGSEHLKLSHCIIVNMLNDTTIIPPANPESSKLHA